ncbi:hypothetical protein HCN44_003624 [Aphidius gifuensis]|uniref:Phosphoglycolate phosphatase n=1 Tax=Aphidius gifuensis TaxID=684658 RepID=A0A834XIU0_APHGI|nr:phosphoglycolate phosphatase 1A, chloroplastic-like [Aphidius gifuensis]KAF7987761.1 hypothetical protein HCN44_003624 [Aphidius gifuensis]
MEKPVDLKKLSNEDIKNFLDSFDTVLSDCDGVLWLLNSPISGAFDALKNLEKLGKKILFVSNNNLSTVDDYLKKFEMMGYNAKPEQIVIPSIVILEHLLSINFEGKALVIGSPAFKKILSDGGIDVVSEPSVIDEVNTIRDVAKNIPEVKAVIFDCDLNLNYAKIMQAAVHVERDDVLFFVGPMDKKLPVAPSLTLIGPGFFAEMVIDHCGKSPIEYSKPSELLRIYLTKNYSLNNPNRCLFIGDSLSNDMKFAQSAGFQKLWVGSGVDSLGSEQTLEPNDRPDFYLPDLGVLGDLINHINN